MERRIEHPGFGPFQSQQEHPGQEQEGGENREQHHVLLLGRPSDSQWALRDRECRVTAIRSRPHHPSRASALHLDVFNAQPSRRAHSSRPTPWPSNSCTAACRARVRSPIARTGSGGCGSFGGAGGLRQQVVWAMTVFSTARPRLRHRCQRSLTCTAVGAPSRMAPASAAEPSPQTTWAPGWASSHAASVAPCGRAAHQSGGG